MVHGVSVGGGGGAQTDSVDEQSSVDEGTGHPTEDDTVGHPHPPEGTTLVGTSGIDQSPLGTKVAATVEAEAAKARAVVDNLMIGFSV